MQLTLQIFNYEGNKIRTGGTPEVPLFVAKDVCAALGLTWSGATLAAIPDAWKGVLKLNTPGGEQEFVGITEAAVYKLAFRSNKPEAEQFTNWVAGDVLPALRKTGAFALPGASATPIFIKRYAANWDRVDDGYFSVIGELAIRLFGKLEMLGHIMPDIGKHGKETRPDVSVGRFFSEWLGLTHPEHCALRKTYWHKFLNGIEREAYQYPNATWPLFVEYVDTIWMRNHAADYLSDKDPAALEYLPKLLPVRSVPPKAADNQFTKIKQGVADAKIAPLVLPALDETEEAYRRLIKASSKTLRRRASIWKTQSRTKSSLLAPRKSGYDQPRKRACRSIKNYCRNGSKI